MIKASIATAKNELSQLLRRVKRGERVTITDRNRPVARLVPIAPDDIPADADLAALVSSGALVPPSRGPLDVSRFLAAPRPVMSGQSSLTATVLAERKEGR
jgi:prevent-host-death family protein